MKNQKDILKIIFEQKKEINKKTIQLKKYLNDQNFEAANELLDFFNVCIESEIIKSFKFKDVSKLEVDLLLKLLNLSSKDELGKDNKKKYNCTVYDLNLKLTEIHSHNNYDEINYLFSSLKNFFKNIDNYTIIRTSHQLTLAFLSCRRIINQKYNISYLDVSQINEKDMVENIDKQYVVEMLKCFSGNKDVFLQEIFLKDSNFLFYKKVLIHIDGNNFNLLKPVIGWHYKNDNAVKILEKILYSKRHLNYLFNEGCISSEIAIRMIEKIDASKNHQKYIGFIGLLQENNDFLKLIKEQKTGKFMTSLINKIDLMNKIENNSPIMNSKTNNNKI